MLVLSGVDEASIDGVTRIAERFVAVRDRNPASPLLASFCSPSRLAPRGLNATLVVVGIYVESQH